MLRFEYQLADLGQAEPTEAGFEAFVKARKMAAVKQSGRAVIRTRDALRTYFRLQRPDLPVTTLNPSTGPKRSHWSETVADYSSGSFIAAKTSLHIPEDFAARLYTSAERYSVTHTGAGSMDEINLLAVDGKVVAALHYSEDSEHTSAVSSTPDTSLLELLTERLAASSR